MSHLPLLLQPAYKSAVWGGTRLRAYGKHSDGANIAETWELSCHPNGPSVVDGGPFSGKTLPDAIAAMGPFCLGTASGKFPVLIKLLDAASDLSIQVHPTDAYAREHEHELGKTEMWVILHADPGAKLLCGFVGNPSREEIRERIAACTLPEVLGELYVQPGDVVVIPAGTVHAIGGGITLAEIQQSSDATYRLYDYGRLGLDGKPRALHVDKALDVLQIAPPPAVRNPQPDPSGTALLCDCPFFRVERWTKGRVFRPEGGFAGILTIDGTMEVHADGYEQTLPAGRMLFVPADAPELTLSGSFTALTTFAKKAVDL